jgi:hypothetical protein
MSSAVLIDAGYVIHSAATIFTGCRFRHQVAYDPLGVVRLLIQRVEKHSGECIRPRYVRWYDGQHPELIDVGHSVLHTSALVRLRLGNCADGHQVGVDELIAHAIRTIDVDRIYLVAGDSDLLPAVRDAQLRGVEVVLFGIDECAQTNQSRKLIRRANDRVVISADELSNVIGRISTGRSSLRVA